MKKALFIPFTRISDDGSEVEGVATRDMLDGKVAIDTYGTCFDYDASVGAFGRWSESFSRATNGENKGNIRAMHQRIAAGKATDVIADGEERAITLKIKVVDEAEQAKVRERVYTGLSIGFKNDKRKRVKDEASGQTYDRIVSYDLVEVSLVDNPSCPGALLRVDGSEDAPEVPPVPATAPGPATTPPAAGEPPAAHAPVETRERVVAASFDWTKHEDKGVAWLRAHRMWPGPDVDAHYRSGVPMHHNDRKVARFEIRKGGDASAERSVDLSDGVTLHMRPVPLTDHDRRVDRMRADLQRVVARDGVRAMLSSEVGSLMAANQALYGIFCALGEEVYEVGVLGGDADSARQDVGYLAAACEALLEFIASEFREQIAGLTVQPEVEARSVDALLRAAPASAMLALSADESFRDSVRARSAALRSLADQLDQAASLRLGQRAETTPAPVDPPAPSTTDAAPIPASPAATPPAAPAPAAATDPAPTTDEPAKGDDEVVRLRAQVADLERQIKAIGRTPDAFGMPVTDGGRGANPGPPLTEAQVRSHAYAQLAEGERDPRVRESMLLRSAELLVPASR